MRDGPILCLTTRVVAKLPGRRGRFVPYDPTHEELSSLCGGRRSDAARETGALCVLRPSSRGGSQLDAWDALVMINLVAAAMSPTSR